MKIDNWGFLLNTLSACGGVVYWRIKMIRDYFDKIIMAVICQLLQESKHCADVRFVYFMQAFMQASIDEVFLLR